MVTWTPCGQATHGHPRPHMRMLRHAFQAVPAVRLVISHTSVQSTLEPHGQYLKVAGRERVEKHRYRQGEVHRGHPAAHDGCRWRRQFPSTGTLACCSGGPAGQQDRCAGQARSDFSRAMPGCTAICLLPFTLELTACATQECRKRYLFVHSCGNDATRRRQAIINIHRKICRSSDHNYPPRQHVNGLPTLTLNTYLLNTEEAATLSQENGHRGLIRP